MKGLTISVLVLIAIVGIVFLIYNFSQQPLNTAGVINNPEPALKSMWQEALRLREMS